MNNCRQTLTQYVTQQFILYFKSQSIMWMHRENHTCLPRVNHKHISYKCTDNVIKSIHKLSLIKFSRDLHLFSRRAYWDLCPLQWLWPLALDGKGAAGVEHVLLLLRTARSFLASLISVWGEWTFVGQVRNLFSNFEWDCLTILIFNPCAASRAKCTSCRLRKPTSSLWQTPDGTYFLQCPGRLVKLPSLDLHRRGRALCVSF